MGLANLGFVLGQFLLQSTSLRLSTLSSTPLFFTSLFWLASLLALFVGLNLSFLIGRACTVFYHHKSRSFRVRQGVPLRSVLGPVLFSLLINDLPASLPSSVSCSLYADVNLAVWSSPSSVPTAVEATQGALIRMEHYSEYWCFPFSPSK